MPRKLFSGTGHHVTALGDCFANCLKFEIGEANYAETIKRNAAEPNSSVCHSHDFCDANEVMLEAWKMQSDKPLDLGNETHLQLLNEAWNYAAVKHLGRVAR